MDYVVGSLTRVLVVLWLARRFQPSARDVSEPDKERALRKAGATIALVGFVLVALIVVVQR